MRPEAHGGRRLSRPPADDQRQRARGTSGSAPEDRGAEGGESSFARGLRILLALSGGAKRSISEIAEMVDLPLSTVYRYMRELRRLRFVEEVAPGSYTAGMALFGLAVGSPFIEQLRLYMEPALRRLVARTGETAMATIRVDLGAMTIAQVESPEPMRLSFTPGTIHPLHAGATATVLLAFESPEVLDRVLAQPLQRFTPATITEPAALARRLAEIRAAGYAVSTGEVDAHATAIAAPVFYHGRILCAVTVSGPSARFGREQVREYTELLLEETRALSRQLSGC